MSYYEASPIGADGPSFTWTDLLTTIRQDAWSGQVYFTGATNDILCVNSVLNPAVQWCAPRAEPNPFVGMGSPFHGTKVVVVPPQPSHVTTTPEPSYLLLMVILVLVATIAWNGWRIIRSRKDSE
jgi:hypothetical protein